MESQLRKRRDRRSTHKNRALINDFLNCAPLPYQSLDPEGVILEVNLHWLDALGYRKEDVVGRWFGDFLNEPGRSAFPARFATFKEKGAVRDVEFEMRRSDGTTLPVSLGGQIEHDNKGNFLRTHCVFSDISNRKAYQSKLIQNEIEIHSILNDLPIGVLVQIEEHIVFVNSEGVRILGAKCPAEILGRSIWEVCDPKKKDLIRTRLREAKDETVLPPLKQNCRRIDGTEVVLSWTARRFTYCDQKALLSTFLNVTDQERAEMQAGRYRRDLKAILDYSPAAIILKDLDGHFVLANRSFLEREGLNEEDLEKITVFDIRSKDQAEKVSRVEQDVVVTGEPRAVEVRVDYGDNRQEIHLSSKFPVFGEAGSVIGIGTISTDITDRVSMEERLRADEHRFRILAESTSDWFFEQDAEGRVTWLSDSFESASGLKKSDILGRTISDLIDTDCIGDAAIEAMVRASERKPFRHAEFAIRRPDGSRAWIRTSADPQFDSPDSFVGYRGASTNITPLKESEQALRESEQRFHALFQQAAWAVFVHGPDARFVAVNDRACESLGYSRDELLSMSVTDVDPDAEERGDKDTIWNDITGQAGTVFQSRHRRKDGSTFPVEVTLGKLNLGGQSMLMALVSDVSDRQRAENALRDSEARFRRIFETTGVGVAEATEDGTILAMNRAFATILGGNPDDFVGHRFVEFTHPDDVEANIAAVREMAEGRRMSLLTEKRYLRTDGEIIWSSTSVTPVHSMNGRAHFVVFANDITERVHVREALSESQELYAKLIDSAPVGIMVHQDERFVFVNQAYARMIGATNPDELVGREIWLVLAEGEHAKIRSVIEERFQTGRAVATETKYKCLDGSEIDVHVSGVPVVFNGNPAIQVICEDITQRVRAERALFESEATLRGIFDNMIDGYFRADPAGRIVMISPSMEEIIGLPAEKVIGRSTTDFYRRPEERTEFLSRIINNEDRITNLEFELARDDGASMWVSANVSLVRDDKGEMIGTEGMIRDITDRRQAEEHFRQIQKMEALGHLTGGIAHDFNNILAVILTNSECLEIDFDPGDLRRDMVSAIIRSTMRAADLTERLLTFARKQALHPERLEAFEVLSEIGKMLRRTLGEAIDVQFEARHAGLPIVVDRGQLENALLNLAINARDAMAGKGVLTLTLSRVEIPDNGDPRFPTVPKGEFIGIEVSDTGCGMTPETVAKAFDPFFTTKGIGEGTGLGLSMVYGFIKQSGGYIDLASRVGEGTTFTLLLPVARDPGMQVGQSVSSDSSLRGSAENLRGKTVLLAEDDLAVRSAIRSTLRSMGADVRDAENGEQAWATLQTLPTCHIVVTDVVMPGQLSGPDLAEKARALLPDIKVLFISGYAQGKLSDADLKKSGMVFLPKPFTRANLVAALERLVTG